MRATIMTYAYLQMGMDSQAKDDASTTRCASPRWAAARRARRGAGPNTFALAAIPARYAMERGSSGLRRRRSSRARRRTRRTPKRSRTSRALSAPPARARRSTPPPTSAKLAALREREIEMKDEYWAEPGRHPAPRRRCVGDVRAGPQGCRRSPRCGETADMEDSTDKSAVTPGPIAPAREMLGYMLLENGQPKEALVEFEAVMKKEPNRFLAHLRGGQGR